jgi:phage N-6-adenine-methyltransferase
MTNDIARSIASHYRTRNTGDNEWYTPRQYIEAVREVLGTIDLDPASCEFAQCRIKGTTFYASEDDGLAHEWRGNVFLNPPYAKQLVARFVGKLVNEIRAKHVTAAIMLTHNHTDTAWFQSAATGALPTSICFTRGRVKFEKADGTIAAPMRGQAFFYYGSRHDLFRDVFAKFGAVRSSVNAHN